MDPHTFVPGTCKQRTDTVSSHPVTHLGVTVRRYSANVDTEDVDEKAVSGLCLVPNKDNAQEFKTKNMAEKPKNNPNFLLF